MDGFHDIEDSGLSRAAREAFAQDVINGLSGDPKTLPCKWFYDVRGSELFEEITGQDEYYPTRTEIGLLETLAGDIGDVLPDSAWVVEFGSGSSRKSDLFLNALQSPQGYVPIDVSGDYLDAAAEALAERLPHLEVRPIVGDFTQSIPLPDGIEDEAKIGFFPGSTIGNFEPAEATAFLRRARSMLGDGSHMVVGVDLKKDEQVLLDAYNDARGVTADFNLNLLDRINRELGAGFDRDRFRHHVRHDEAEGRIEMHIESTANQTVRVDGHVFEFAAGETIHTENSYKYAVDEFGDVARAAGWSSKCHWTDDADLFSIHLLSAT
ncbi:MAG: L-histidine N(alpha)-methyltransferase [Rhodospirillaceae bacterium]